MIEPYFCRASQDMIAGDIVALADDTTTSRIFAATATEIDFQNASAVAGLLGFMWHDHKTDASGNTAQSFPSTVETGAGVKYPVSSYSDLMHRSLQPLVGTTPDIGNMMAHVCIFTNDLEILLDVCSNGAVTTVNNTLVGLDFGLILDGAQYKADVNVTSGNAAGLVCVECDELQPNFNVSAETGNACWFRVKATHQEYLTGLLY